MKLCTGRVDLFVGMEIWVIALSVLQVVRGHSQFTCEPITVPRCLGLAYNNTYFPNIMGHYDQNMAAVKMEPFLPLIKIPCSSEVRSFFCGAFMPKCTQHDHVSQPCRELCEIVHSECQNLVDIFGITWPEELLCDRLQLCDTATSASVTTATASPPSAPVTERTPQLVHKDHGIWCPRHLKTPAGQGRIFLGVEDCAPPCPNMYFRDNELEFAKNFIGIISIFCLCATLFTFLTFLIDVKRFRYPERPIIFYAVCYSIVSLMYFIGFLVGNQTACNRADEKSGLSETVVLGSQSKACTIFFMLLYFFTMAGTVWWVILTITWFLAAGPKWSCEAIEQKALWYHSIAWGAPGALTVMVLAINKAEGDNMSGVCFVGLYDLSALLFFVIIPLCFCVVTGLFLLLAGIVSLNNVRQVIQHDERNQEKLKKFMIRIGVFSGLYLGPLVTLLGCYIYEHVLRETWEITWVYDHCQEYHIPCPQKRQVLRRPELSLFMIKYLMTLIVGSSAVFWVGSRKTCSEWANFFNRKQKTDPISESRRVLQESCEYFLKHNTKMHTKQKHYRSGSHKLKVISKSMGTSTAGTTNHGTSAVALASHDCLTQATLTELKGSATASVQNLEEPGTTSKPTVCGGKEPSLLAVPECVQPQGEKRSKAGSISKVSSPSGSLLRVPDGRLTPRSEFIESHPSQSSHSQQPGFPQPSSSKDCMPLLVHTKAETEQEPKQHTPPQQD